MTTATRPRWAGFDEFVASRRAPLLRAARSICRDPHTAEDLLQAALERTYVAWPGIRDHQAAEGYVRRVMYHQHIACWRRARRGTEVIVADVRAGGGAQPPAGPGPDDRAHLWDLVCRLPPRQRAAVVLRYYEDLSEAETARALGCAVGTVKSNTSRGLATLRDLARDAAHNPREETHV